MEEMTMGHINFKAWDLGGDIQGKNLIRRYMAQYAIDLRFIQHYYLDLTDLR